MAQDALLKALEEDAREQCKRILADAEEKARDIIREAEKEALRIKEEGLKALREILEKQRASLLNNARILMGGLKLEVRREVAEDVLNRVINAIEGLPKDRYAILLDRLYKELKSDWEKNMKDKPVVHINPGDAGLLKDPEAVFSPDPDVKLGVLFTSGDGRVRYENTIPARIKKYRSQLAADIDRIVFGETA